MDDEGATTAQAIDNGTSADEVEALRRRIERLEGVVDDLRGQLVHGASEGFRLAGALSAFVAGADRFIPPTSDGWLLVMIGGMKTSLPSGLRVSLTSTSGGRDYGVVLEGVHAGKAFDVKSGNLKESYRRIQDVLLAVAPRQGGPLVVDGVTYDLQVTITYSEGGTQKMSGPHAARTDPGNPVPSGQHDVEIPDFPHEFGSPYGPHGTVWFRIGHSGDRYVHPGKVSLGCVTCLPGAWEEMFGILHCARRSDGKSIGTLTMPALGG